MPHGGAVPTSPRLCIVRGPKVMGKVGRPAESRVMGGHSLLLLLLPMRLLLLLVVLLLLLLLLLLRPVAKELYNLYSIAILLRDKVRLRTTPLSLPINLASINTLSHISSNKRHGNSVMSTGVPSTNYLKN